MNSAGRQHVVAAHGLKPGTAHVVSSIAGFNRTDHTVAPPIAHLAPTERRRRLSPPR